MGADLKERKTLTDLQVRRNLYKIGEVFTAVENLPQPTIAMMNGFAFGGGMELALACDFRIAADTAVMGLTETGLAIIPGAGGTQRLPRLIGEAKALELILTARRLTAVEALDYGVVTKVSLCSGFGAGNDRFRGAAFGKRPDCFATSEIRHQTRHECGLANRIGDRTESV